MNAENRRLDGGTILLLEDEAFIGMAIREFLIAAGVDEEFPKIESISVEAPLFTSPHGTGCSRYVATVVTEGGIFANWQQSQPDFSQPLVGNFVPMEKVAEILG